MTETRADYLTTTHPPNECDCGYSFGKIERRSGCAGTRDYLIRDGLTIENIDVICPKCGDMWHYCSADVKLVRLLARKNPGA